MENNQCSELFENAFDSHTGGCVRNCMCGRVHFDDVGVYSWEEGELEDLEQKSQEHPDRYIAHDHSVGCMYIDGAKFVYDCPCGKAAKYEEFILKHAEQISEYLRKKAVQLREKADKIDVPK